jgi:hypothetical protein
VTSFSASILAQRRDERNGVYYAAGIIGSVLDSSLRAFSCVLSGSPRQMRRKSGEAQRTGSPTLSAPRTCGGGETARPGAFTRELLRLKQTVLHIHICSLAEVDAFKSQSKLER